ncbi:MAG TPA: glycosyltransferase family 4 protein [Acidimicrobiales bacterium]|jgi:glycosyltransferase involved in cell wall biosynthesis|nr:glycosyltransferase family 4 protein [Acidimicrobiales bacterium]
MSGVHQFVPMLHRGDAVGQHTRRVRDLLVGRGIESRIYVELIDPDTADESVPASTYALQSDPGDVLLYQLATASDLAPWLAARPETLVVNYHNITPPELFAAWDNALARHQVRARAELSMLASRTRLAVAVSGYNEAELTTAGYRQTAVVPPAALVAEGGGVNVRLSDRSEAGQRWLSVGRMAPNKALHDALRALLITRAHVDPDATLEIVGQSVVPSYTDALHRFVWETGLGDAVTFRGHVSDAELADAFRRSDVLVVTSAHEGFGVPVIEAMTAGLPVVANRSGALPEVVGEGGVVVDTTNPWVVAETIAAVLSDPGRHDVLVAAGRVRAQVLDLLGAGDRLVDLVCALR